MSRIDALLCEMGIAVNPCDFMHVTCKASRWEFARHVVRSALFLRNVDTTRYDTNLKLFIALLYTCPPSLAFVDVRVVSGKGRARIVYDDGTVEILDVNSFTATIPISKRAKMNLSDRLEGPFVPIAADYLVTLEPVEHVKPRFIVEAGSRRWFVYKALKPAAAVNLYIALTRL